MAQLEHIEAIEKRLWNAADTLRANSNYASNEYFMPVMGSIFLRHAYSRYLSVKDEIAANDWSLTPGRYVGVAPEEEDENFDFEEALRNIHVELEDLNAESVKLAATIKRNFEELGV
jgi:type I restriction-modification system DNA methylase subunit